jgi:5-methylthioadenosine/S-adenosylhomocysteine deaminase
MSVLIRNATVVTMNAAQEILKGDIYIEDDRIREIGSTRTDADQVIDATGKIAVPGLIQTHVHLCQTLFRGQADDLELLDWLRQRIWPLEGAHDEQSLRTSALLGLGELIRSGTTAIVDMETVHHTEHAIQAIAESGMRAVTGKVMMDFGEGVPPTLMEKTADSLRESALLLEKWHGYGNGLIEYAFTPRFVVSCTEPLLKEVARLAVHYGVKVHTHASENRSECRLVEALHGLSNVRYLDRLGLTGPHLLLVHCIWLDREEMEMLASSRTKVVHCPSSNLKLASGIAQIPEMLAKGCQISLGADAAPCNNNLDPWLEMRLAALIQKPRHGPTAMPARTVFELATIGGARALGLEDEIGSLEAGKKADLAIIDGQGLHAVPAGGVDLYSRLVYEVRAGDVETTIINGKILMQDRQLQTIDEEKVKRQAEEDIARVARRAGVMA